MRYVGKIYRPPSEHDAYILQATIGCSWNHCTYCDMYRDKDFAVRPLQACLDDLVAASRVVPPGLRKVFVADGDAIVMDLDHWLPLLDAARAAFPALERVSCYATARGILVKTDAELLALREAGLSRLYIGPESGDDVTLKRIAKGADHAEHVEAAVRARGAGMTLSVIALLGAGGIDRSGAHAEATAALITEMDPTFFSALTLTVVPGTPIHRQAATGRFQLPTPRDLLGELRVMVAQTAPTDTVFRTNHASNYLPLAGRLPADRDRIVAAIDAALAGRHPLREERHRGL